VVYVVDEATPRVFINCPFDELYEPLFDALVFVAVAYNFAPTTSSADGDPGIARIERLRQQLRDTPYSLHDLSRCTGEGEMNTVRMNMPFELGMAIMRQHLGDAVGELSTHHWAAFVPEGHLADAFISDLAGFDLLEYGGDDDVAGLIAQAASFFATKSTVLLSPAQIRPGFDAFREASVALRQEWAPSRPPWSQLIGLATQHAAALLG
jgi:hypothetical protein